MVQQTHLDYLETWKSYETLGILEYVLAWQVLSNVDLR